MRNFRQLIIFSFVVLTAFACKKDKETTPTEIRPDPQVVTKLAGSGNAGFVNGSGSGASFNSPRGLAADRDGNIYVSDYENNVIRKITQAGVVTTFAGTGGVGSDNGTGVTATFNHPLGLAIDGNGNLYVAEHYGNLIRKITPAGVVSTLAGGGSGPGINGTGTAASFAGPTGIAVDASGNVYVCEQSGNRVRKITPAGVVTTLAGSGAVGSADATGTAATFNGPYGITVTSDGSTIYVADAINNKIRKVTAAGVVTTFAGSGVVGDVDGTGTAATFADPAALTVDSDGTIYVVGSSGRLRKITSSGVVTTFAGSGAGGSADGTGTAASFGVPWGICQHGYYLYVSESVGNYIRRVSK